MNKLSCEPLAQLLCCYFHQDFMEEYESPDHAIAAFIAEEPIGYIQKTLEDIEKLLSTRISDEDIDKLISNLGCAYDPHAVGRTSRLWLQHVQQKIKEAME